MSSQQLARARVATVLAVIVATIALIVHLVGALRPLASVTVITAYAKTFDARDVKDYAPQTARAYHFSGTLDAGFLTHVLKGPRPQRMRIGNEDARNREYAIYALSDHTHVVRFEETKTVTSARWEGETRARSMHFRNGTGSFAVIKLRHRHRVSVLASQGVEICDRKQCT